ncbi:MAG: hypothetical protein RLZZ324_1218 [Candidatus Parcubacteria bacterium]|jgi:hypothetical protein
MSNRNLAATSTFILVIAVIGVSFAFRGDIRDEITRLKQGPVPPETSRVEIPLQPNANITVPKPTATVKQKAEPGPKPSVTTPSASSAVTQPETVTIAKNLPVQFNLKVPMVFQAPFKIWDDIHEDACEEASALMLRAYENDVASYTPDQMETMIQDLVTYENATFGDYHNTTAAQTTRMLQEHLGVKGAKVVTITSIDDIKSEIAAGRPVAVPADGKALPNPNFRNGGPVYHMLVIKGYTKDGKFVSNDPGTRLGENFVYDQQALFDAIHDYNGGDVPHGAKVGIVVE